MSHPHSQLAETAAAPSPISGDARHRATRKIAIIGAATNFILTVAQMIGGFWSGSQALVADAFHTLSDLVSDGVVLIASKEAHKAADDEHPYGHGRIETIATVLLGLILSGVAVGIFLNAWQRLFSGAPITPPQPIALFFAALAIVCKEMLYHYTMHTAKQVRSSLLEASAWHHRSDAFSSVIVLVGIAGAQFGLPWLDSAAAILVAIMILFMAGQMILNSTMELVDTGVEPEQLDAIRSYVTHIEGVQDLHMLRTRKMGSQVFADAHIQVDNFISVSEGHHIAESVIYGLKKQFPDLADVTVHIDPEDDETAHPSSRLPLRNLWMKDLQADARTHALWNSIETIQAHYVEDKIYLDIFLRQAVESAQLEVFLAACASLSYLGRIRFYQQIAS